MAEGAKLPAEGAWTGSSLAGEVLPGSLQALASSRSPNGAMAGSSVRMEN
jgi:hypothetical protein